MFCVSVFFNAILKERRSRFPFCFVSFRFRTPRIEARLIWFSQWWRCQVEEVDRWRQRCSIKVRIIFTGSIRGPVPCPIRPEDRRVDSLTSPCIYSCGCPWNSLVESPVDEPVVSCLSRTWCWLQFNVCHTNWTELSSTLYLSLNGIIISCIWKPTSVCLSLWYPVAFSLWRKEEESQMWIKLVPDVNQTSPFVAGRRGTHLSMLSQVDGTR